MRIRLLPEAERDLEIGADFYGSQTAGLGAHFHDCLSSDIESLKLYAGINEQYRGFFRSRLRVEHDLADLLRAPTRCGDPGRPNERLLARRHLDDRKPADHRL